jgi:glyoxylase-like metal-dependent hydrolase (beta-lactamase superfamily II)
VTSPWYEVGDRVWVRRYEALDQTIGAIGSASGLAVIDTRATHRDADELRRDLGHLPGSVTAVINTHGHWDHAFGNARFVPTRIWGHVRCAAMVRDRGDEMRARMIAESTPEDAEAFTEVTLTPPTELFEESAVVDLGDRQLELRHLGPAHTDNDIVISVRDAAVLFVGDLLENAAAPAFGDSYPIGWARVGRALLGLVDGPVVPGHGGPFDIHFAERQVGELELLASLARDAVSGAIGLDDAVGRSPFAAEVTGQAIDRARVELSAE